MDVVLCKSYQDICFLQVAFDHNLVQLPFYQFEFENWSDIMKQPVAFDHKQTGHAAIDYFKEKQLDYPLPQELAKGGFLHL